MYRSVAVAAALLAVAAQSATAATRSSNAARGRVLSGLTTHAPKGCHGLLGVAGAPLCTHGPDLAPPGRDVRKRRSMVRLRSDAARAAFPDPTTARASVTGTPVPPTDGSGAIVCYGDGTTGNRVQVMYVVASDRPDRYTSLLPTLVQYMINADGQFNGSAAKTGGVRHVRFVTPPDGAGACSLDVKHIVVPPAADDNFSATIAAVQALGYNLNARKYVMYVDANVYCGIGSIYGDDSAAQTNANNGYHPQYSRIDNGCWNYGEAHELMHNLGGVQTSAPHATAYNHCWDESDQMCYADGSGRAMQQICPTSQERFFDCNNDDYFNTAPPAGSYLATHWNTAFSSFLSPDGTGTGGTTTPPPPPPPPPADTTPPAAPRGLAATVSGTSVALRWTANTESDLAGYRVLRNGTQIATLGKVTTYTDSGLTAGSTYSYSLKAADTTGNLSAASASLGVVIPLPAPPITSGATYQALNANSGLALDINRTSSRVFDPQLLQSAPQTVSNQRWVLTRFAADGSFILRNVYSAQCAMVASSSKSAGAAVIQSVCAAADSQHWAVTPTATAGVFTLTARHSGLCLDVSGSSTAGGARIVQATCSGSASQKWKLTRTA